MTTAFLQTANSLFAREFNPKETMQWLTVNRAIWWSWGSTKQTNLDNKALVLKVSGKYHKAYVVITLNFNDTYQVNIVNLKGKILNTYKEVHVEDLVKTIDNRIETLGK